MKQLKNWKNQHRRIVAFFEGFSIAIFFVVVISQFVFFSHIKITLPKMAEVLPSVLVMLTNQERAMQDINTLETSSLLTVAAQAKANDMATREYFSHVSPEGLTPWFWLDGVNYPYEKAGENLAVNFVDSEDVIKGWLQSPTHKANIMSEKYEEIGIATAQGKYKGKQAIYIVQYFGTQKKSQNQILLLNSSTPNVNSNNETVVVVENDNDRVLGLEFESQEKIITEETIISAPEIAEPEIIELAVLDLSPVVVVTEEDNTSSPEISEEVSITDQLLSAPRTIVTTLLLFLLLVVTLKLAFVIHLRHPRLVAVLFTLLVLIAILLYINNTSLFQGDIL